MPLSSSASSPVPLSRVWSGDKVLAEDIAGEDLADVLDLHSGASAWWVLDRTSDYARDELDRLAGTLDLDRAAVHDLRADDFRTKYEEVGQARILTTTVFTSDRERLRVDATPVSILVTDRVLVCLTDPNGAVDAARVLSDTSRRIADHGLDGALWVLVNAVIDNYTATLDWLESATDELSETLFAERPMTRAEQLRGFGLRRSLSGLRRGTEPMRTVLSDLVDNPPVPRPAPHAKAPRKPSTVETRHWKVLTEKLERTANGADALRDALGLVFDTSLALADYQLNTVVKKLTGWAAIIAVPTLITGFVGMNVGFPLADSTVGFWVYLSIMVVAALVLWLVFRRHDWI